MRSPAWLVLSAVDGCEPTDAESAVGIVGLSPGAGDFSSVAEDATGPLPDSEPALLLEAEEMARWGVTVNLLLCGCGCFGCCISSSVNFLTG